MKKNMLPNICEYFHYIRERIIDIYYDIKIGIINMYKWFSIIWNDRNYDYVFIYIILKYKLVLMKNRINKTKRFVGYQRAVKNISIAIHLLDRLIKDEYLDNALKGHYEKYGDPIFNFIESDEFKEGKEKLYRLDIVYPNVHTEKEKEIEIKEFKRKSILSEKIKKSDREYLFKILNKHITSWWD